MQVYQVGGSLRDELLGITPVDIDYVVVGSTAKELLDMGFTQVGKDFPVFLHPITKCEYALARRERKIAAGHQGFSIETGQDVTLYDDLKRRDITINALAKDLSTGTIIDLFNGRIDIKNKIIRHISPAFIEDPLRVLRVARFAAKFEFAIASETRSLIDSIIQSNELASLSKERVWLEIKKALILSNPLNFFKNLAEVNAIDYVLPEITNLLKHNELCYRYNQIDLSSIQLEHSFSLLSHFILLASDLANLDSLFKRSYIPKTLREQAKLFNICYPKIKYLYNLNKEEIDWLVIKLKLIHSDYNLRNITILANLLKDPDLNIVLTNIDLLYSIKHELSLINYEVSLNHSVKHINNIKQQKFAVIDKIMNKGKHKCI